MEARGAGLELRGFLTRDVLGQELSAAGVVARLAHRRLHLERPRPARRGDHPDNTTVAYAYNATGARTQLTYPDTRTASSTYSDDGLLTSVTGSAGDTTLYSYRADGSLLTTTLPNGITTSYTYDDAGRLASISHAKGTTLLSISYTRDENGNPTTIDDSLAGQSSYSFDALDQLTAEVRSGTTTTYTTTPSATA